MENRVIKFRAWDANPSFGFPKKMYYDIIVGRNIVICEVDEDEFEEGNLEPGYMTMDNLKGGFILMQYTGLPDDSKNDVYEGDILADTKDSKLLKWLVVFQNGCFGIRNIGIDGYMNHAEFYPCNSIYFFNDRKVVGNIYQNAELVNQ